MTVELRNCELCGVLIPVDRTRQEPGRYICDSCRAVADPIPAPATTPTPPFGEGAGRERPELAATQPVSRPPRAERSAPVEEPIVVQPATTDEVIVAGPAWLTRRRMRFRATLLAIAVLLPLVPAVAVLACSLRGKGFAVRGATGDRLEWFGTRMAEGARRLQEMILGESAEAAGEVEPDPPVPPGDAPEPQAQTPGARPRIEGEPREKEGDPPPR